MSETAPPSGEIKWMTSDLYYCPSCRMKKRHDIGVKKEGTKVIKVVECTHCHVEREVPA